MRHPHTLTRTDTALLIIDVQEKFQPAIPGFTEIVENIVRLTLTFQMFKMPILVTEQYPRGLGNTVSVLKNQFNLLETVEKIEFSCVQNKSFADKLRASGLKTFVVCGVESHVCVNQTVLDLAQMGHSVHVVADAIGSRHELDHNMALKKMFGAGAVPASTEMVLFELAERAGTQSFKNIQRMVRFSLRKSILERQAAQDTEPIPGGAERVEVSVDEAQPQEVSPAGAEAEPLEEPADTNKPDDLPGLTEPETANEENTESGPLETALSETPVDDASSALDELVVDEQSLVEADGELEGLIGEDGKDSDGTRADLNALDDLLSDDSDTDPPVV